MWVTWFGWAFGWIFVALGLVSVPLIIWSSSQPRLAYSDGYLVVFLGTLGPLHVPIELVECFFLGYGPSLIPLIGGKLQTSTIVVRLAESAKEWKHRDVSRQLGHWCDGYIVIRGTWCEPISAELVQRLNARLVEVHRQVKAARELETA